MAGCPGRRRWSRAARRRARIARLDVQSHPSGPWLVRAGRRALAVPPPVGRALQPLHGAVIDRRRVSRQLARAMPGEPASPAVADWLVRSAEGRRDGLPQATRGLLVRVPLLPAAVVAGVARALAPLATWPALAAVAATGLSTVVLARPWAAPCSWSPSALALFAAGALWHELGHAAALRREGYRPGGIGAGLLVFVPVFYADVSATGLLPRCGRLRVDLAGLAFQCGAAGVLAVSGLVAFVPPGPAAAARAAAVASLTAVVYGLLPLPRSDGGWALRDACDSGAPPRPAAERVRKVVSVVQHGLLGAACVALPPRLLSGAAWLAAHAGFPADHHAVAAASRVLSALAVLWWLHRAARAVRPARRRRDRRYRA